MKGIKTKTLVEASPKQSIKRLLEQSINLPATEKSAEQNTEPFKRIIFEKNIFESVCKYLKNYNKICIITSPKPSEQYLQFLTNMLNEWNITYWSYVLESRATCDNNIILKTCAKVKNADIIVALGTGTIADISKITAFKLGLPYCVIPTAISHYGILNDVAYMVNDGIPKLLNVNNPEKVFIDESIIKKSPERFVISTICFAVSLLENLFSLQIKKSILGECEVDLNLLNKKIQSVRELINWVTLSKDFALLNLMDYIIDLNEICKDNHSSNSIVLSLLLTSSTLKNNFGEKCLFSSTVLLQTYSSLFNQKNIIIKSIPDMEKIMKIYGRKQKVDNLLEDYTLKTQAYTDPQIIIKLKSKQIEFAGLLKEIQTIMNRFAKKLLLINTNSENLRMVDEVQLYDNLALLPFIQDNFLLNILTRYGYLNVS
jgi:hypothetical protein